MMRFIFFPRAVAQTLLPAARRASPLPRPLRLNMSLATEGYL